MAEQPKPRETRARKEPPTAPQVEPIAETKAAEPSPPNLIESSQPTDTISSPLPSESTKKITKAGARCTGAKACETCGNKPRKTPAAPTEKQIESRKIFGEKVRAAKELQAKEAGLTYKEAIKRVYAKPPKPE